MSSIMEDKNDGVHFDDNYAINKVPPTNSCNNEKKRGNEENVCQEEASEREASFENSPEKMCSMKWIISDIYIKNQENSPNNF